MLLDLCPNEPKNWFHPNHQHIEELSDEEASTKTL
jgi:hypothetical protein